VLFHLEQEKPVIKSRLSAHLDFWKRLSTPEWLLDIIEHGFQIPFDTPPPKFLLQNCKNALAIERVQWVRDTLNEYLTDGFIEEVDFIPHCVLPLQLKDSSDKTSLIFDMSPLNDYVSKSTFKLEGWEEMFDYAKLSNFAIKFDIRKYFYCIDIRKDFKTYFGFMYQMENNQKPKVFTWTVLPFGYTRAPFLARALMKPLIGKWRKLQAKVVVFYDDGMAVADSKPDLKKISIQIQCDLLNSGLVPGVKKCIWTPQKLIDWNGLTFDFQNKRLSIMNRRIQKAVE